MWIRFAAIVLAVLAGGCAAKQPPTTPVPALSEIDKIFGPLEESAYVGIGSADVRTMGRAARDTAHFRAQADLARNICGPNTQTNNVLLVGQRNTQEKVVSRMYWVRLWMRKDEVDRNVGFICPNRQQ